MAMASWMISQLERDWSKEYARGENEMLNVDMKEYIGGIIRE
jgi:hypothetical protein